MTLKGFDQWLRAPYEYPRPEYRDEDDFQEYDRDDNDPRRKEYPIE